MHILKGGGFKQNKMFGETKYTILDVTYLTENSTRVGRLISLTNFEVSTVADTFLVGDTKSVNAQLLGGL